MKVVGFHSMGVSHTVVQRIFGIGGVYMTNVSPKVSCHLPQVQQSSSTRRKIEGFNWRMLHDICSSSGILPLLLVLPHLMCHCFEHSVQNLGKENRRACNTGKGGQGIPYSIL